MQDNINAIVYSNALGDDGDQMALAIDGKVIYFGDYYHEKAQQHIEGIIEGIELCGHKVNTTYEDIDDSHPLFSECGFLA